MFFCWVVFSWECRFNETSQTTAILSFQKITRHLRQPLFCARRGQVRRVEPRFHQSWAVEEVETGRAVLKLLPRIVILVLHLFRRQNTKRSGQCSSQSGMII